jgi:hypothetical protein
MNDSLYMLRCSGRDYSAQCTVILVTSHDCSHITWSRNPASVPLFATACHVLLSYMMTNRTTTLYTCLVFLKQTFYVKIVNRIKASIWIIIFFWIFLTCESHFNLMSICTVNTRTNDVSFLMMFFMLIAIIMSNHLRFRAKCNNSYLIDAKRVSWRRTHSA